MSLETGDFITDLEPTNPTGLDAKSFGDDHLRLIKKCVQQSFPNIDAPVTATPDQLNGFSAMFPLVAGNYFRALDVDTIEQRTPTQVRTDIGAPGLAVENTFSEDQIIAAVSPRLELRETDQAADSQRWSFDVEGQVLLLRSLNDAGSVSRIAMQITRSGNSIAGMQFGNSTDDPDFTFTGAGQLLSGVGTDLLPTYSFGSDPDTGIYRPAQNQVGVSTLGTLRVLFTGTTVQAQAGVKFQGADANAAAPSYAFTFATDTGMFCGSANPTFVRFSAGGVEVVRMAPTEVSFFADIIVNSGSTLTDTAVRPFGDADTGLYFPSANVVGIAAGGVGTTIGATNTGGLLEAGTYTPTCVNIANCAAIVPALCMYQRVGRIVQVSGIISVDPTNNSVLTRLSVSVPIAPANFTLVTDASGHGIDNTDATVDESACWEMFAITGGALLELRCVSIGALSSRPVRFSFMYRVSTS